MLLGIKAVLLLIKIFRFVMIKYHEIFLIFICRFLSAIPIEDERFYLCQVIDKPLVVRNQSNKWFVTEQEFKGNLCWHFTIMESF